MAFVPLVFQPDLDCNWDVAPGALVDCRGVVPMRRGTYATWGCETPIATYTSGTEPVSAIITRKADGAARFFIGNKQSIYEYTSTTAATDRSSTTYSASTETWTFAQFGDVTIATNLLNNVQSSSAGAFADLAGTPPKAQLVAVNLGFVMLANYNDGTAYPDGWACSDIEDPVDWTVTATNQADRGRLYDTPGPIRALVPWRDSFVAFKDDSMYIADYVGDPSSTIWSWRLISDKVGCSAPHGVGVMNDQLYFLHRSGFYVFDGAQARRIGKECTNFLFETIAGVSGGITFSKTQTTVDHKESVVFFGLRSASETKITSIFCYNIETGRWSYQSGQIFTNASFASAYPTAVVRCTQSDMIAFDSGMSDDNPSTAVMIGPDSTGKVAAQYPIYPSLGTTVPTVTLRSGSFGSETRHTEVSGVKPRLYKYIAGTSPTLIVYGDKDESNAIAGAGLSTTGTWNSTELRWNVKRSDRYLSISMRFPCFAEIAGVFIDPAPTSRASK